jgi:transmembrane sensor
MEHHRLQYLIEQYSKSQINAEELHELNQWYESVDYGNKSFDAWVREFRGEEELINQLYGRFDLKVKSNKRIINLKRTYRAISVAASLIIVFSIGFALHKRQKTQLTSKAGIQKTILPGSEKAILKLANGQQIVLDNHGKGKIASQYGVSITQNSNGRIVYKNSAGSSKQPYNLNVYNTIETKRGGQYNIELPDGTKVWLNAASSLKYPLHFSKNERRVELTGEAYFEVAHNKNQPFKVISNNQEVRDLGTHFNINAYDDEPAVSTTLLEGSVSICNLSSHKSQTLVPGQQAVISANDLKIATVNTEQVISWKKGYFLFDNMDINSIMRVISRWYDVDIKYADTNSIDRSETFGGTFSRQADLTEILRNLQQLGHVNFKIEGRKITISK